MTLTQHLLDIVYNYLDGMIRIRIIIMGWDSQQVNYSKAMLFQKYQKVVPCLHFQPANHLNHHSNNINKLC